jgi:hypothetical protein
MDERVEGHFIKGGDIRACRFRCIVKGEEEVKRLDHNQSL